MLLQPWRHAVMVMALFTALHAPAAMARVVVSFYSVPGSVLTGRSVHAFITLTGSLDGDGRRIDENYGFSAKYFNPAGFYRPIEQTMLIETPQYIARARFHFRTAISDDAYRAITTEVRRWWHDPTYLWEIDKRNCVTFVGVVAKMSGLNADFPPAIMRKPRVYLDHIAALNPGVDVRKAQIGNE